MNSERLVERESPVKVREPVYHQDSLYLPLISMQNTCG